MIDETFQDIRVLRPAINQNLITTPKSALVRKTNFQPVKEEKGYKREVEKNKEATSW